MLLIGQTVLEISITYLHTSYYCVLLHVSTWTVPIHNPHPDQYSSHPSSKTPHHLIQFLLHRFASILPNHQHPILWYLSHHLHHLSLYCWTRAFSCVSPCAQFSVPFLCTTNPEHLLHANWKEVVPQQQFLKVHLKCSHLSCTESHL